MTYRIDQGMGCDERLYEEADGALCDDWAFALRAERSSRQSLVLPSPGSTTYDVCSRWADLHLSDQVTARTGLPQDRGSVSREPVGSAKP